jgi:hypothetical protein
MAYSLKLLKTKYRNIFNSNGIVLLKNYFNNDETTQICSYADDILQTINIKNKINLFTSSNITTNNDIKYFLNKHPPLSKFLTYIINPIINNIYGRELVIFRDTMNISIPNSCGLSKRCDILQYGNYKPKKFVNVMLFSENTHIEICNNKEWRIIETSPRDILLFDCNTIYRGCHNNTKNINKIFIFTYNEKSIGEFYNTFND